MFKDIKLPFGISFMEGLTLVFFITLGYLGIYRYSFYNTLGIPWYLNSITPTQILTSSFKSLLTLFLSGLISLLIFKISILFKTFREFFLNIILVLVFVFWGVLLLSNHGKAFNGLYDVFNTNQISITSILHYMTTLFLIRKIIRSLNVINKRVNHIIHLEGLDDSPAPKSFLEDIKKRDKESVVFFGILVLGLIITTPSTMGHKDALILLKSREKNLNQVVIKASKEPWYLIEMTGDKVLLIKGKTEKDLKNDFKLIEYKDVERITAPQKEDMDKELVNYLSSKIDN